MDSIVVDHYFQDINLIHPELVSLPNSPPPPLHHHITQEIFQCSYNDKHKHPANFRVCKCIQQRIQNKSTTYTLLLAVNYITDKDDSENHVAIL